jgi:hypothetical protein
MTGSYFLFEADGFLGRVVLALNTGSFYKAKHNVFAILSRRVAESAK